LRFFTSCAFAMLVISSAACAAAAKPVLRDGHDAPVPANEPRDAIEVVLDLPPQVGCEEAFDLALYKNLGVDLVEWQGDAAGCRSRRAKIRFLPARLSRDQAIALVKGAASKMELAKP
jgi:hypothetical protein